MDFAQHVRPRQVMVALFLAALCLFGAPGLDAQDTLPNGRELVDRYVELIGGRDAVMSRPIIRSTGSFQMPAMGITGELVTYQAQPGRNVVQVNIPGLGEIRSGFDGTVGWSMDPIQGPRVMTGAELDHTREEANFASTIRDPSLVTEAETVERTEMNGKACWRVRLTWRSGRETFDCYAEDAGLLVASVSTQDSPMGSIQITTLLDDYEEFGGFRIPTRMTQHMMGQEQVMVIEEVDFPSLDESVFALPPEIQALVGR